MALQKVPEEREYGAVAEEEAITQAAPPSLEPSPAEADQEALEAVAGVASQAAAGEQDEQQRGAEQQYQPVLRQPNMWRIPHRYDRVMAPNAKPPMQSVEDMGMYWDVLLASPNVDPTVRAIAKAIIGERGGNHQ